MDTPSWRPWPAGWPGPAGVWCALGSPPWLGCGRRGDARGLTEHLVALRTPTLILQGERDNFGKREEAGNWATAPGEFSPRCLRSPLAAKAAFEQEPPHLTSIGASFVGFRLIGARIRPGNHSQLLIRRGLRHCDRANHWPALGGLGGGAWLSQPGGCRTRRAGRQAL